jgi:hypothetical protein
MSDCDRRWEVDVYREGRLGPKDAQSFERHLKACSECRLRKSCDERLRLLGRALPEDPPSELTLRRLRTRILRDVATGARSREPLPWARVALAAGFAIAVLGGGTWIAHRRPAPITVAPAATVTTVASVAPVDVLAGSVTAFADARWRQTRQDGVERVVLDDGTIAIHVRPQRIGERFLVELPDGELEVRGTTFDVAVARGATSRVHVDEGLVEVRLQGRSVVRLGAGDAWTSQPSVASPPPPAAPVPAPAAEELAQKVAAPRVAPSATGDHPVATPAPDDGAAAYARAVDLLRAGHGDDAAAAFHAFLVAHPAAPEAEDASFLEAVALARAGRVDAAGLAAEHHLARFPGSFHRKEAAILAARAASQRGDCARARAVLAPWLGASLDADVRAAMGACLGP